MQARRLSGIAAAAVTVSLLALAQPSTASPTTPDDFFARLTAAIDTSRVFERGTTLTLRSLEFSESLATPEPIVIRLTVNPSGSLTYRQTTLGSVTDVRCAGLDRCWTRQLEKGGDRDWHAMPAGAVYYSSTTPDLFAAFATMSLAEGELDISPQPGGLQVFTITYPAGTSTGEMQWTVTDRRFTWRWAGTDATGHEDVMAAHTYASTPTRSTVTRPPADTVGAPTSAAEPDRFVDSIGVLINR